MDENEFLAERFQQHRAHLRAVAFRILGSRNEAEDAVQEAWLKVARADTDDVANLAGWLTTVVARVCLNMLQSRKSRREEPLDVHAPESQVASGDGSDPEYEALLADSVGLALLVVLDTLGPAERLAFVLHDMFAVPFDEISTIVDRSPAAARQLASRARRRVQASRSPAGAGLARRHEVVDAFLAASRGGDFDALVAMLDPSVVLRADQAALLAGATPAEGAASVAQRFSGRARAAKPALIDGLPGAAWAPGGEPKVVFSFTIDDGVITAIDILADPQRLTELDLVISEG